MLDDKALRCDCGYEVTASNEAALLEEIRLHAQQAHGIQFSVEDALLVVLRSELEVGASRDADERLRPIEGGSR